MTLGELLIESKREGLTDLETLISFLVFEKKVHSLKDEKKCLERYLLPKHQLKMNRLLNDYKRSKNIKPKPSYYMIIPQRNSLERLFVIALDEEQARTYLERLNIQVSHMELVLDDLISETIIEQDGEKIFSHTTVKPNKYPAIIGKHERKM